MEKEILLIRHGRPASENNARLTSGGFARWVRAYNHAPLHPASHPCDPVDLSGFYIMCSQLRRAQLSAHHYTGHPVSLYDACFNEMDIPRYRLPVSLNAWGWVYLNRALWMAGKAGPFESFADAKVRARSAVNLVEEKSQDHARIAIFGHGMTSRVMTFYLKKRGWRVANKDYGYWGIIRLHLS